MDRLLLVEVDPTLIRMLTSFLTTENFQVDSVARQSAAAKAMEDNCPDLALVDISLSEGNGFGVCAYAKELGIPVIFLTASGDEYSVVTGLDTLDHILHSLLRNAKLPKRTPRELCKIRIIER